MSTYRSIHKHLGNALFACALVTAVSASAQSTGSSTVLPPVPGTVYLTSTVDLSAGQNPSLFKCLMATAQTTLGANATYLGQTSYGAARISLGGNILSFYPLKASTNLTALGINLGMYNTQNVGTSCANFDIAPALYSFSDFGSLMASMGLIATFDANGLITITSNDNSYKVVYVVRPDYLVTPGAPGTLGAPTLIQGTDGTYRFTDSAGNTQILRPAFVDPIALTTLDLLALSALGSTTVQLDGSVVFTDLLGKRTVLKPDPTLAPIAAANANKLWWQDSPNHFFYRSSYLSMGQGFTVVTQ